MSEILRIFRQKCEEYHEDSLRHRPNREARRAAYRQLLDKYGPDAIIRHVRRLANVFNREEEEVIRRKFWERKKA
jgi:hypothetical protein